MMKWVISAVAWSFVLGTLACNPFKTGEPYPPVIPRVKYPVAASPRSVLTILKLAMSVKEYAPYMDRLSSDEFSFVRDPFAILEGFPNPYNKTHEQQFLSTLYANSDTLILRWSNIVTVPEGDGEAVTADYELAIGDPFAEQTIYEGKVEMLMEDDNGGGWGIVTWEDFRESSGQTWTTLRASAFALE